LFVTLYIDELKVSRILPTDQYNFTSWKAGFTIWDLPVKNLSFSFEWTYTKPITYKHYIVATNFNNDSYNMGDWMRDNSQVFFASLGYRPIRGLWLTVSYLFSEHGTEYPYTQTRGKDVTRFPVLTDLAWVNSSLTAELTYQIFSNASVRFRYIFSERKGDIGYDSQFMHGKTNTIEAGIRVGL